MSLLGRGGVQWVTVVLMLEQEVTGAKEDLGVAPNLNFPHLHKTQIYIKLNPNKLTSTSSVAAAVKYCSTAATAMGLQTKKWLQFQKWRVHTYMVLVMPFLMVTDRVTCPQIPQLS